MFFRLKKNDGRITMRIHGSGHSINRERDGKRILFVRKKTLQRRNFISLYVPPGSGVTGFEMDGAARNDSP